MAAELNLAQLAQLTRKDVKEASKKITTWKKAQGIILFSDYKLEGKYKVPVAFPFKKSSEQQAEYKKVAQNKIHKLSKVASCDLIFDANGTTLTLDWKKGGLKPELIQAAALEIFAAIGITTVQVIGQSEDAANISQEEESPEAAVAIVEEKAVSTEKINSNTIINELKTIAQDKVILAAIIANIKNNKVEENAAQVVKTLEEKIRAFLKQAQGESNPKLLAEIEKIKGEFLPQVQKVAERLVELTAISEEEAALNAFLKQIQENVTMQVKDLDSIHKTLAANASVPLPSGKALLDLLD